MNELLRTVFYVENFATQIELRNFLAKAHIIPIPLARFSLFKNCPVEWRRSDCIVAHFYCSMFECILSSTIQTIPLFPLFYLQNSFSKVCYSVFLM